MAFMFPILLASLRAIGVAVTVIVAGILATRFKVLTPPEHSCMSKLSMKVAMPALVFSRILYCNQCADRADCPRCAPFSEIIRSSWILFLLPLVVVGLGTSLGRAVAAEWQAGVVVVVVVLVVVVRGAGRGGVVVAALSVVVVFVVTVPVVVVATSRIQK